MPPSRCLCQIDGCFDLATEAVPVSFRFDYHTMETEMWICAAHAEDLFAPTLATLARDVWALRGV